MHHIMIKKHNETGLHYLCYTRRDDYLDYLGSGIEWKKHLQENGKNVSTIMVRSFSTREEASDYGRYLSEKLDVVSSEDFANLAIEACAGANQNGATRSEETIQKIKSSMTGIIKRSEATKEKQSKAKSKNRYINNGVINKQFPKGEIIPDGWLAGRMPLSEEHKKNISLNHGSKKKGMQI